MSDRNAKRLGLSLSRVLETGLARASRKRESQEWLNRNRAAIEIYNQQVDKRGVFSDGLRSF